MELNNVSCVPIASSILVLESMNTQVSKESDLTQNKVEASKADKKKKLLLVASHLCVLALGTASGYLWGIRAEDLPLSSDKLIVGGRIEAPETYITAAASSRVNQVMVKEGDHVHKGQLIVSLDASIIKTKLKETGSAIQQAQRAKAQAQQQIAAVQQNIAKAKKKSIFAKIFSTKKGRQAEEDRLRAQYMQAKMLEGQAQGGLAQAQSLRSEAGEKLSYFNIVSPIDGIVTIRSADPGEVVKAGQVLVTISDPTAVYMRGFIPEGNIAKVKLGDKAHIVLDNKTEKPIEATLSAIDKEPSFTPQNVYLKEDRERQVFGCKLRIVNPDGSAKAGMPAEATFDLKAGRK